MWEILAPRRVQPVHQRIVPGQRFRLFLHLGVERPVAVAVILQAAGGVQVDRFERAVSGRSGHATTFVSALKIVRFVGGDADLAWQLLSYYNATKCDPEWSECELRHKWEDALEKER